MAELVSILISAYNAEKWIRATIGLLQCVKESSSSERQNIIIAGRASIN